MRTPPLLTADRIAIRRTRVKAGISVPELAERVGISTAHAWNIENGHNSVSDEVLHRYARELNVDIYAITLGRRDEPTKPSRDDDKPRPKDNRPAKDKPRPANSTGEVRRSA